MISQEAKNAFSLIYTQIVDEVLNQLQQGHYWQINQIETEAGLKAREFVVLTLCSYDFRLFVTIHFTCNMKTISYVAEALNLSADQLNRDRFYDYMGEFGNNICGALKRELGRVFPHLGMSTPDRLEERAFKHFSQMKYEYSLFSSAVSEKGVNLFFSLYVCPYGDLDFAMPQKAEAVSTGEIELF
ncbi:MAG: hypothetical protein HQM11_08735 [SAR324 cluster bacterium]|nr:hypothetical protein [SAR324 cluster bacterium]